MELVPLLLSAAKSDASTRNAFLKFSIPLTLYYLLLVAYLIGSLSVAVENIPYASDEYIPLPIALIIIAVTVAITEMSVLMMEVYSIIRDDPPDLFAPLYCQSMVCIFFLIVNTVELIYFNPANWSYPVALWNMTLISIFFQLGLLGKNLIVWKVAQVSPCPCCSSPTSV